MTQSEQATWAGTAAAGVFGLVLLAAASYGETVPVPDGEASVVSEPSTKPRAASEADAVRPFRDGSPCGVLAGDGCRPARYGAALCLGYTRYVSKAATGVQLFPMSWPVRQLRVCSASTSTGLTARRPSRRKLHRMIDLSIRPKAEEF
jgi:hypothetical protein